MVAARQVVAHVSHLGLDHVEVVEQPFAGGRDRLAAMHVVGGRAIRRAQLLLVITKAREVVRPLLPKSCQRRRQRPGAELEGERVRPLLELPKLRNSVGGSSGRGGAGPTEKWSSDRRRSLPVERDRERDRRIEQRRCQRAISGSRAQPDDLAEAAFRSRSTMAEQILQPSAQSGEVSTEAGRPDP